MRRTYFFRIGKEYERIKLIPAMHKMRAMTLSYSKPVILHPYNGKQRAVLPAVVFYSFAI
jgi:hypothetical protein